MTRQGSTHPESTRPATPGSRLTPKPVAPRHHAEEDTPPERR